MNIRFLSALAISAAISTFTPMLPTAYAEPPCQDNDNNGICDDFCPDFNGDGTCDVPGGVGVIPQSPEASNPELILEGTPHGDDPNMPPVTAPVLPDVSEVLPPGNPPPVVQLPENAYVVPTIPNPPVFNPDQPYVDPNNPGSLVPAPVGSDITEILPPGGPAPVVQLPENAYVVPTIPNPPVFNPDQPYVAPNNAGPPATPVQQPQTQPPAIEESQIPLLPLPEPPPPAAVPDYLNEPPMITYDPEDHVTLMPKPYEQPTYQQPSSTYEVPDYTYNEPDTYPDSGSSYGGSGSSYGGSGSSYGDSGSSYPDSGSSYGGSGSSYPDSGSSYGGSGSSSGGSGSSYGDTGSSYGGTVCDEDGYCS